MPSPYRDRIEALAEAAARARASFDPPATPPAEARAMAFLRDGVGEAVGIYVDARTDSWERFGAEEFDQLEWAMNEYLELYARCYGHDIDADFSVREAAEALIDTHNIADVAYVLTSVPER